MKLVRVLGAIALLSTGALVTASLPSWAGLTPYDPPTVSCVSSGLSEITLKACAGASGAPAGLTIQWEEKTIYDQFGWLDSSDPRLCALSLSGQPSMMHPGASRWELGPGQCEEVLIGDVNFDETGVSGTNCGIDPLQCGTEYVFHSFAHAGRSFGRSDWSADVVCSTQPCPPQACVFTQGYWKTHGPLGCKQGNNTNAWPASSLMLGSVSYTDVELCSILNQPAPTGNQSGANGLITLAHQLIAAKLNQASGADCIAVDALISSADALIGPRVAPPVGTGSLTPSQVSSLVASLDQFNNGILPGCPNHCGSTLRAGTLKPAVQLFHGPPNTSWGSVKSIYR